MNKTIEKDLAYWTDPAVWSVETFWDDWDYIASIKSHVSFNLETILSVRRIGHSFIAANREVLEASFHARYPTAVPVQFVQTYATLRNTVCMEITPDFYWSEQFIDRIILVLNNEYALYEVAEKRRDTSYRLRWLADLYSMRRPVWFTHAQCKSNWLLEEPLKKLTTLWLALQIESGDWHTGDRDQVLRFITGRRNGYAKHQTAQKLLQVDAPEMLEHWPTITALGLTPAQAYAYLQSENAGAKRQFALPEALIA